MEQPRIEYDALVIGTGAAGFHCANRISQFGKKSVALVTEGILCGTSRNTGSDKQTYYKLGLGGASRDSVAQMAEDLFAGGATDGDTALCEAALSSRCFLHLCELGVEFPTNRYGEYVGYKTDHDPYARATSAGPLTSKFMTEVLEREFQEREIPVLDQYLAIEILKDEEGIFGLLCLDKKNETIKILYSPNIVLATGGPAGIYEDSVYPLGHHGSSSLALTAGAHLQNMTEWQYGLASLNPRWNVSGTYMQVLPRLVSVDEEGREYEFLSECYADPYQALSALFLKGYQWPFDSRKAKDGSSVIDLLVYRERVMRGRRVYLDFTKNPFGMTDPEYTKLSEEAYEYLRRADALFGTPIDRLCKMNMPAVTLYQSKGVDITKEYLEIAVCAQHNNGGIAVDLWWQTCVKGLFAVGECAGTHGIARPGGSALNAGQVGSLRAAQYISERGRELCVTQKREAIAKAARERQTVFLQRAKENPDNSAEVLQKGRRRMSDNGGFIRKEDRMQTALAMAEEEFFAMQTDFGSQKAEQAYLVQDMLMMQRATLYAMLDFARQKTGTRGSALYYSEDGSKNERLEDDFKFSLQDPKEYDEIQEVYLQEGEMKSLWRKVRPIPQKDDFFENVWKSYCVNKNIE